MKYLLESDHKERTHKPNKQTNKQKSHTTPSQYHQQRHSQFVQIKPNQTKSNQIKPIITTMAMEVHKSKQSLSQLPSLPSPSSSSDVETKSGFVRVHGLSKQGSKSFQEDSFLIFRSQTKRISAAAVFDGHGGYNGVLASSTAQQVTMEFFTKFSRECETWTPEHWTQILDQLFEQIHTAIRNKILSESGDPSKPRHVDEKGVVRSHQGDPVHGGTTGTLVVLVQDVKDSSWVVISANVGDSAALYLPSVTDKWEFLTVVSPLCGLFG